ncbi:copper resistance D family protein [Blastococcus sp. LR1]|uniref:copper resistance D family protein n=1 Tax=Blastococcus sp. LR1 TaxID=2877000 RepID=UPI001CD03B2D|nr:CopD family protein [Blastococcus sp. LR1]MCA0145516.1 CopD family protein [Blastococcus sp. LR1]
MSVRTPDVAAPQTAPTPAPSAWARRPVLGVVAGAVALIGVLLWAYAVGGAGPAEASGRSTARLAAVATLASRVTAVGTVGALLAAAVLLPATGGRLSLAARRASAAAGAWAAGWAVATGIGAYLSTSVLVGVAPTSLPWTSLQVFLLDTGAGRSALVVVVLTALLAATAGRCTTSAAARVLLAGGLLALVVPVVLSGHSTSADDHLVAVTTLAVHVTAATLWIGGLLALLVHGRAEPARAAARFSGLALICFLATAVTGVLAAGILLGGTGEVLAALGTGYGWLLLAKTAGLVVLGLLGWQHRRRTLPELRAGRPGSFRRFAAVELLVMLATVAVAVALAASPPPAAGAAGPGSSASPAAAVGPSADPMAGHDHGELSVGVLVDEERFHVAAPVAAGSRVSVFNGTDQQVTITAEDGSFDVVVPGGSLLTFQAPADPGEYGFTSRHSPEFTDVLLVK